MQWTDGNGNACGDGAYGSGYQYGYAQGYSGGTTTDTATPPWHATQLTQWPDENGEAYASGIAPGALTWDIPDIPTAPPPDHDAPDHEAPSADTPDGEAVQPVFVDSSGRRQRRVRRAARLLVIPAGGYVALLVSTVLGGPALSSSFVPLPSIPTPTPHPAAAMPDAPPVAHRSAAGPTAAKNTSRPVITTAAIPSATPVTAPPAAPTPTAAPSSSAPLYATKGRALGASHRPQK
ncbi:hypothetical protein ACWGCW_00010 [Streptomyces sp. NPDC054933]